MDGSPPLKASSPGSRRFMAPPPSTIASTRHPSALLPRPNPRSQPHMPRARVLPRPTVLHSCQAATCSLQHAAQLLCYNNKLRSAATGRSHYLQLLLYTAQGDTSDPNFVQGGALHEHRGPHRAPPPFMNTASCSTVTCLSCAGNFIV